MLALLHVVKNNPGIIGRQAYMKVAPNRTCCYGSEVLTRCVKLGLIARTWTGKGYALHLTYLALGMVSS